MINTLLRSLRYAVGAGIAALMLSALPAQAVSPKWQTLSFDRLTAVWWQWAYAVPASSNALIDDTGAFAYNGQPYTDLLFLAGKITLVGGPVTATRSIAIRPGVALFFPIINTESDNVCVRRGLNPQPACAGFYSDPPPNFSVPQLGALSAAGMDTVQTVYATLTKTDSTFTLALGAPQSLAVNRYVSPPFAYKLPATDNLYQYLGLNVSGNVAPAVGDGFYTFVPSNALAVGYYVLAFGGSTASFSEAIAYRITVSP